MLTPTRSVGSRSGVNWTRFQRAVDRRRRAPWRGWSCRRRARPRSAGGPRRAGTITRQLDRLPLAVHDRGDVGRDGVEQGRERRRSAVCGVRHGRKGRRCPPSSDVGMRLRRSGHADLRVLATVRRRDAPVPRDRRRRPTARRRRRRRRRRGPGPRPGRHAGRATSGRRSPGSCAGCSPPTRPTSQPVAVRRRLRGPDRPGDRTDVAAAHADVARVPAARRELERADRAAGRRRHRRPRRSRSAEAVVRRGGAALATT